MIPAHVAQSQMSVALITGSAGLIGSEACKRFHAEGLEIAGIDNDMRAKFFGEGASTAGMREKLERTLPHYRHHAVDIRNMTDVDRVFATYGAQISLVIHTAAQPSHDWAAREPGTDFSVNAVGTLNLLEAARQHCPAAVFIFTSTNKVYGDTPNRLPLQELERRWEIDPAHPFSIGIDESMSIDQTKHSLFGVSKAAADLLVQEYGRYFGLLTTCIRGGCLTGPAHAGAELHGFLAYLMRCTVEEKPYRVFGYRGKQVRDNIHSHDLVEAFWQFFRAPRSAEVYNLGGSRHSNCSMLEAIDLCQEISGRKLDWTYVEDNRVGDHIWWISDVRKFQAHYPEWKYRYGLREILEEIHAACRGEA
ncbi:MAG TPA: NAD-dependent epimerase/dehydratase family protein [Chthoniobacteraceae bacterium]|jgi:CDP-paratose 2-epimerase